MKKQTKNGFTLVELLAVIVILAIILVIAVPKVMSVIEDSKKATLESTAKMIASSAEKQKVQNTVLGNTNAITCDSVAKINKGDYANCSIEFDNNTAKVTIEGKGKFNGLWVCEGTKTSAIAQNEACSLQVQNIEVNHPLFLKGQELTPDKFEVIAKYSDGSTRILHKGGLKLDETQVKTITSPNWPNSYTEIFTETMMEADNYWEYTFEGAKGIQITFDETSEIGENWYDYSSSCGPEGCAIIDKNYITNINVLSEYDNNLVQFINSSQLSEKELDEYDKGDWINIYDKDGKWQMLLDRNQFAGETYTFEGEYIKLAMHSDLKEKKKGFSATITPIYDLPAEYTISPSVVPNTNDNFDITISVNDQNISKKITTKGDIHNVNDYVMSHKRFDTVETNAKYNGKTYDAGIRYVTVRDILNNENKVNNKVYYNCENIDTNGFAYGQNNYDYATSCEVWRIIGVFDTKTSESGTAVKRVKLINTASTFKARWDSSEGYYDEESEAYCYGINCGLGINQWGESTYSNGTFYEGADLMRLLNGYYISKSESTCKYCNGSNQGECSQTCTSESLKNVNMKVLTASSKEMIENVVWDTYAVNSDVGGKYLQEKGISAQYTGKSTCDTVLDNGCNDNVTRTTSWTGLVGLMSVSDIDYANGWLSHSYAWTISPNANEYESTYSNVWYAANNDDDEFAGYSNINVFPSVYLKSGVKVISGNGDDKPYILGM